MDNDQHSPLPTNRPNFDPIAALTWTAVSSLAAAAITYTAVQTPGRVRLLGLFFIAVGVAIGLLVSQLGRMLQVTLNRSWFAVLASMLTIAALVGITIQSFQREQQARKISDQEKMAQQVLARMNSVGDSPKAIPPTSLSSQFHDYLAGRVRQLGRWPAPWPEVWWIIELAASIATAAYCSQRFRNSADASLAHPSGDPQ